MFVTSVCDHLETTPAGEKGLIGEWRFEAGDSFETVIAKYFSLRIHRGVNLFG